MNFGTYTAALLGDNKTSASSSQNAELSSEKYLTRHGMSFSDWFRRLMASKLEIARAMKKLTMSSLKESNLDITH